ncbi:MAG: hypothetical protein ACREAC_12685 [Blastocatellia bacterium]
MNCDESGEPFEVFVEIGKAGSDMKALAEALGRVMSLTLRIASPMAPRERVSEIAKQITGIGGARSYGFGRERVLSLPDSIGRALIEEYFPEEGQETQHPEARCSLFSITQMICARAAVRRPLSKSRGVNAVNSADTPSASGAICKDDLHVRFGVCLSNAF